MARGGLAKGVGGEASGGPMETLLASIRRHCFGEDGKHNEKRPSHGESRRARRFAAIEMSPPSRDAVAALVDELLRVSADEEGQGSQGGREERSVPGVVSGSKYAKVERRSLNAIVALLCRVQLADLAIRLATHDAYGMVSSDALTMSIVAEHLVSDGQMELFVQLMRSIDVRTERDRQLRKRRVVSPDVPMMNSCLRWCSAPEDAFVVLDEMAQRGVLPDARTYTHLVPIISGTGGDDTVLPSLLGLGARAFGEATFRDAGHTVVPDGYLVNCVMHALVRGGNYEAVERIFGMLDGAGNGENGSALAAVKIDQATVSIMLSLYGRRGRMKEALSLFRRASDEGIVNMFVVDMMIDASIRSDNLIMAMQVFECIPVLGLEPTDKTYTRLLNACGKFKNKKFALRVSRALESDRRLSDRAIGMDADAEEREQEEDKVDDFDTVTGEGLLRSGSAATKGPKRTSRAKTEGRGKLDSRLANALLYAFASMGDAQRTRHYLELFRGEEMYSSLVLTPVTRGRVICALARTGGDGDGDGDLLLNDERDDWLERADVGAADDGALENAERFDRLQNYRAAVGEFMSMYDEKIEISKIVYRSLFRSVAQQRDARTCARMLEMMEEQGHIADHAIWKDVLLCLGSDRAYWPLAGRFHADVLEQEDYIPNRVSDAVLSHGVHFALEIGGILEEHF